MNKKFLITFLMTKDFFQENNQTNFSKFVESISKMVYYKFVIKLVKNGSYKGGYLTICKQKIKNILFLV